VVDKAGDSAVEWQDPRNPGVTRILDQVHFPRPITPLAADVLNGVMPFAAQVINGYVYMGGFVMGFGGGGFPPPFFGGEDDPTRVWEIDALPRIREICDRIRLSDYAALSVRDLVATLPSVFQASGQVMMLTMRPISGIAGRFGRLMEFCRQEVGERGAVLAATMVQGFDNDSAGAGLRLGRLAELAAQHPAVEAAVLDGRFDELASMPEAAALLAEMRAFLAEYGWRASAWGEIHVPTWAEDATPAWRLVRSYVEHPEHSPLAARKRAEALRERAIGEIEASLAPEKLATFRSLLSDAQVHVPISEDRARWQLAGIGVVRVPLLALADKLVAAGAIDERDDIFFLRLRELQVAGEGTAADLRSAIASRRADFVRWQTLTPPRFVGPAPREGNAGLNMISMMIGNPFSGSTQAGVLKGIAASRGVVTARARVLLDLHDGATLAPGEILVCPSTAPPWTPLFALAAAVVTDAGGLLSHSAVVAREYGIPCVVGTQSATTAIRTGDLITVDGDQGVVTVRT
jgi:pyruvate,water dikinase